MPCRTKHRQTKRLLVFDRYSVNLPFKLKRTAFGVVTRNGGSKIGADIKCFARGKRQGNGPLRRHLSNFLPIQAEYDVGGSCWSEQGRVDDDRVLSRIDPRLRFGDVSLDDHQVVFIDEESVVQVTSQTTAGSAESVQNTVAPLPNFEFDGNGRGVSVKSISKLEQACSCRG